MITHRRQRVLLGTIVILACAVGLGLLAQRQAVFAGAGATTRVLVRDVPPRLAATAGEATPGALCWIRLPFRDRIEVGMLLTAIDEGGREHTLGDVWRLQPVGDHELLVAIRLLPPAASWLDAASVIEVIYPPAPEDHRRAFDLLLTDAIRAEIDERIREHLAAIADEDDFAPFRAAFTERLREEVAAVVDDPDYQRDLTDYVELELGALFESRIKPTLIARLREAGPEILPEDAEIEAFFTERFLPELMVTYDPQLEALKSRCIADLTPSEQETYDFVTSDLLPQAESRFGDTMAGLEYYIISHLENSLSLGDKARIFWHVSWSEGDEVRAIIEPIVTEAFNDYVTDHRQEIVANVRALVLHYEERAIRYGTGVVRESFAAHLEANHEAIVASARALLASYEPELAATLEQDVLPRLVSEVLIPTYFEHFEDIQRIAYALLEWSFERTYGDLRARTERLLEWAYYENYQALMVRAEDVVGWVYRTTVFSRAEPGRFHPMFVYFAGNRAFGKQEVKLYITGAPLAVAAKTLGDLAVPVHVRYVPGIDMSAAGRLLPAPDAATLAEVGR